MRTAKLAGTLATVSLLAFSVGARAADDATLLRVFLTDGSSLVSYGEFARIGDRVVFSMPTASTANPPLHLVNLAADRVDWDRTNRYASSARAAHYIETQAHIDYAALSNEIAQTLNDVSMATDAARRLALVERARKILAEWPQNHFNYRLTEVRQMLGMLDEAIADLRAAAGSQRFNIVLAVFADPAGIVEPLLPPPTPKEAIEQILAAARFADTPFERTSLLSAAVVGLERDAAALPAEWAESTRSEAERAIFGEIQLDRTYQTLTKRMMMVASRRARLADVGGLERLIKRIHERDAALGKKRPDAVYALVTAVAAELDAARKLRLVRDQWVLRAPALRAYRTAIRRPMDLFAQLKMPLQSIRALSGTPPATLGVVQRTVKQIVTQASAIVPPVELKTAHGLLISAVQLAGSAAEIRREAALAGDMARAWDASSAAAGALMLGARARTEIQDLLRLPQLR